MAVKTIEWKKDRVVMIDQRLLPQKEVYRVCRDYRAVAEAIRGKTIKGTVFGDAQFLPNGQLQPRYVVFKVVDGKTAKLEALE